MKITCLDINSSATQSRIGLAVALGLQFIILKNSLAFLSGILASSLVITALIIIPGVLTVLLLYNREGILKWQVIGYGIGFGTAEVLVWGRLLLILGTDTSYLGYTLLATTILKIVWMWKRSIAPRTDALHWNWRLALVPLLTLIAIWIMLFQVNLTYPTYAVDTERLNDKWGYLAVIQQFLVSPAHLNLRPDAIIFGSNTRLSWNSWLYFQAATGRLTGLDPVTLVFHDFRPALFGLTTFGLFLLGYELFGNPWLALAGAVLQLLLVIGVDYDGFWVWMRLEEDKYFAFVTLMPFAWVFLLRVLKDRHWADLIGLMAVSLSLALTHPLGIPGLLLTSAPFSVVEWWLKRRKGFSFLWLVMVLSGMGIFIALTFLDKVLVVATPYIQNYLQTHETLAVYTVANAPVLLPPNARFILLALIPLGIFSLKDRIACFFFLATAAVATVLCVPFVTAIISQLTTSVGMNRYHWLIPYGFIVVWLIVKTSERWSIHVRRLNLLDPIFLTTGTIGVVVLISGWHQWTVDRNYWLFRQDTPQPTTLSENLWQAFLETADMVQNKRAITPVEYGLAAPTLWPGADLLIFNSPIHAPMNWPKIESLYQAQDIATAWMLLDELQPQALFVPHSTNLYGVLSQNPESLTLAYNNGEVSLFLTDVTDVPRKEDALAFYADSHTLKPGDCIHLRWETVDLQAVRLDGQSVENVGEHQECPSQNAIYQLEGTRADSSTVARNLHVFVSPNYDYTASFGADRYVIQAGGCVKLHWHVEGIDSVYFQDQPTVGESSSKECPSADTLYTLRVKLRNQQWIVRNVTVYVRS